MAVFPLFGVGLRSRSPVATAQRRVNVYYDVQKEEDKSRIAVCGRPGLTQFANLGASPARCLHAIGDYMVAAVGSTVYRINAAGVATAATGALLTSSGRCYAADDGTQVVIVDGTNGYVYNPTANTVTQITDADFPSVATYVTWLAGYFVVTSSDGSYYISALDNPTAWDALDFDTAEASPDGLVAVLADHGELLLVGEKTLEFRANTGAADFPFTPVSGAAREYGLAARASLCKFGDSVVFLARNRQGQVQVVRMVGYNPQSISDSDLDEIVNGYATVLDATGLSYQLGGHAFYQLNFTTANASWLYDAQSGVWSELTSGDDRHLGEIGVVYQEKPYCSSYTDGKIYEIDPDVYSDAGAAIKRKIVGRHLNAQFEPMTVSELYIDAETGIGLTSGQGSDPQIMLRVSKDNGRTWGSELWRDMGAIGEYTKRVVWRRLGYGYDFLFELSYSEPTKFILTAAAIKADAHE